MRTLLDVNVIIALLDPFHICHDRAHRAFEDRLGQGWATCPIVENGAVRILGSVRYPDLPGGPEVAGQLLAKLIAIGDHEFWPDDISLIGPGVRVDRIGTSAGVTDTYLLALAVHHGGKFATFDRRLSTDAVVGGKDALLVID